MCSQLPGALLMSTAGNGPVSAVEWIAPSSRVVQLQLGIRIPDGSATQTIKLYRSSREDALYTANADPGITISKMLAIDVLQGDRIYVTLDGAAVTNAGVQMFIVGDSATFPSTCQVALEFSAVGGGDTIDNLCGADFTFMNYDTNDVPSPPTLAAGPFTEEGMGASIALGRYYVAPNPIDHSGDFTIQYWVEFNGVVDSDTGGWMYSDDDLDATGGIGMVLYTDQMTNHVAIDVTSCTDATNLTFDDIFAQYPAGNDWHFVRVVHSGSDVALCVDGAKLGNKTFTKTSLATTYAPYLGKDVKWLPTEPSFNGELDDVRVIAQALPCN